MIITVITQEKMSTTSLPTRISGRYWISMKDSKGSSVDIADVEGIQNHWLLHSSPLLTLFDVNGHECDSVTLSGITQVIDGKHRKSGDKIQLYVEMSTDDRTLYKKYCVRGDCRLNIGRASDNQIVFNNKYVSAHHAILIWKDQRWSVTDTQSSNGTFVNENRIATRQLNSGDVVYLMGFKIIVGNGFFALNNPDGAITITSALVAELAQQTPSEKNFEYEEEPAPETYQGSPRLLSGIVKETISIDPPPPIQKPQEVPIVLLVGPALTMGLTAVVMAAIAIINLSNGTSTMLTALPTLIMSFSMLCGTLLWPLLSKRSEKNRAIRMENERQTKYCEYLDQIRNEIYMLGERQKSLLFENCPSVEECERIVINRDRRLWERSAGQADFLELRLGLGDVPLDAEIKFPESRFSVETDLLQNEVKRLKDVPKVLSDAPITCSVVRNALTGIIGAEEISEAFLQTLLMQIMALHNYEEVKLAFFIDEADLHKWNCYKTLPYICDEKENIRFFAVGVAEEKSLALHLEHIWTERAEQISSHPDMPSPHYVLIASNSIVAQKVPLFSKIGKGKDSLGFSGIVIAEDIVNLPKECSTVIKLEQDSSLLYDRNDLSGTKITFRAEYPASEKKEQICNILSNLVIHKQTEKYVLPNLLTFLEMYGVGKTQHLNALVRWKENSPVNTLQAPIGVGEDGALIYLDLHEKAHGPHGLIAGMTGSGKSEIVITYLLSMAVNYHPDEVSFVLIDYKGGGLAGAFENASTGVKLPHIAGTITNLDGAAVNRALISIQSELRRRQEIFNLAKQISDEGTMDIYKYQKMFRSGMVSEAVPHLFIVSDEFAELKVQQPEFMSQLVSAARIGRSLGVHLILATQKPTGVVDDQIWSNSRFRICLKVQEKADSVEMLKRSDAAELKETGRFYLQVGFNELFELGQSAWCGAPYIPIDQVKKKEDNSIAVVDHLGRVLLETKEKNVSTTDNKAQVVSIVQYLSDLASSENIAARQLWLPPIPELIYLDDLEQKYGRTVNVDELEPIIGEFDDPFNQSQGLLTIPFSREGNALLYGAAGSGKNALLNTMLVDLIRTYDARCLNIYIIDLGEETLRIFAEAPQVGEVLLSSDSEKIVGLFEMLHDEIAVRKKLFTEGDGSYRGYCQNTESTIPQILVVIRNYAAFAEQFENLDEKLIQITRECNKYGIYFLMTANAANTVRYRVTQNFAKVYALQLNDTSDYIGIFNGTGGIYPSKIKGRGICKFDRVYEFQTAYFAVDSSQKALRTLITDLADHAGTVCARPVPTLPERVVPSYFGEATSMDSIPIGVEKASLRSCTLDLSKSVITVILSRSMDELGDFVQGISEQLAKLDGTTTVIDCLELLHESKDFSYSYLKADFANRIEALFKEMVRRNNSYKRDIAAGRKPENYPHEYFVLTGLQQLFEGLTERGRDELNVLFEKAETAYNIRFILCDNPKALSGFSASAWYKRHFSGMEGVWVGDGIAEQYTLKIGKLSADLYSEIPPHFGYVVKRGKPILAKLIVGEYCEEDI